MKALINLQDRRTVEGRARSRPNSEEGAHGATFCLLLPALAETVCCPPHPVQIRAGLILLFRRGSNLELQIRKHIHLSSPWEILKGLQVDSL